MKNSKTLILFALFFGGLFAAYVFMSGGLRSAIKKPDQFIDAVKDENAILCDVCGKNMHDQGAVNGSAAAFYLSMSGLNDSKFKDKQLGVYRKQDTYHVCYECVLKAMGVKPR